MTDTLTKQDFRRQTAATVSAGYARNLFDYAASVGIDPQALADRSGIAPADLDDPDARVPMAQYVAAMQAAKAQGGAAAFALDLGAAQDFREFSVVGLI